ncbi:CDT1-like protein a, chloroplastic [Bidens hawaiensis]|uniref:CDT1-like protein a, chloroplastic n=1 Tax=Bidens hawaiensis TaxID=980011 RepID=UPI00404A21C4
MDSTGASSSPFDSFKSKKILQSSISKPHLPDQSPWSSKTPEKPTNPAQRPLTCRQSLRSVKQVREAAKKLHVSDPKPPKPSVSSDPETEPTEAPVLKPGASGSLPEKYEMLNSFFDRLLSAIRLFGLKRSTSTFTNVSKIVESLTDRKFGYSHLAQLKFILPESIETKKILVLDERTSCMKPDLHITLNFSVVQKDEKQASDYALLSKLFRSRLLSFCKSNEGDEVPEERLPEPFSKPTFSIKKPNLDSVQHTTPSVSEHQPVAASLISQSFKRRFSKQALAPNAEPVNQESTVLTSETRVDHKLPETPVKKFDLSSIDATPVKMVSTPFSATPAQSARPPVRRFTTPDQDSVMHPSKLTRRASGKRSITFDTPVKNKMPLDEDDDYLSDILSDDLLASIKENELKVLEENDPEISQAKWRKKMVAGLPKLFDTLWFYFQSVKRTIVKKDELMNMLTSSQVEIIDKKEAEEQLRLLQEIAPEWIYEKVASSGDILCCVNKISSSESIRTRLSNAN